MIFDIDNSIQNNWSLNIYLRGIEGLSTGIMYFISRSYKMDDYYLQKILLCHWIFSLSWHLYPSKLTLLLDIIGIHFIIIIRLLIMIKNFDFNHYIYVVYLLLFYDFKCTIVSLFILNLKFIVYAIFIISIYHLHHNYIFYYLFYFGMAFLSHYISSLCYNHLSSKIFKKYNIYFKNLFVILFHIFLGISFYYELLLND
jgi:hypothetical protein